MAEVELAGKADAGALNGAADKAVIVQAGNVRLATIDALLALLVDAAPGTLDTLNELAAALGDDANFAATTATALAGKQPIAPAVNTVVATGAAEALAWGGVHDVTMDQSCTFSFSSAPASGLAGSMSVIVRGAFTPTWPASVDWPGGAAPSYVSPAVYTFMTVDGGTTVLGFLAGAGIT